MHPVKTQLENQGAGLLASWTCPCRLATARSNMMSWKIYRRARSAARSSWWQECFCKEDHTAHCSQIFERGCPNGWYPAWRSLRRFLPSPREKSTVSTHYMGAAYYMRRDAYRHAVPEMSGTQILPKLLK